MGSKRTIVASYGKRSNCWRLGEERKRSSSLKCGGWTGFLGKSNTVKASELPQQKTDHIYHRALLIEEMPKAHWSRLPFTMWSKYDAIERPISDVRISSVDLGQPNPCREEEMFLIRGI